MHTSPDTPDGAIDGAIDGAGPAGNADVVTDARRRNRILVTMSIALMGVVASVSGLNVAQAKLTADLGASQGQVLWMINAYTLALAALLLPIGAIGDRIGRKPVLASGLVVFIAANLASAFAGTPEMLIATRAIAGIAAAMIMPVTLSVLTSSFPTEARARAIGIWAGVAGAGGIIGLVTSAALVDNVAWQWIFAAPIATGVISLAMTMRFVPNSREHSTHRFDIGGSILSALAVGGLVLGIHEGPERGWTDWLTLASLVIGIGAAVAFVWWERRQDRPLLDVRVFRNRSLAAGSAGLVVLFAVMFGLFLVVIQYLQVALMWSALKAAVALLPIVAVMMPLSAMAPRIAQRLGLRSMLGAGALIAAGGLTWMALAAGAGASYLSLLPGLLIVAAGMGLAMSPSTAAITDSLPPEEQGVASALNDTVRELGASVGVALLGSVLASGYRAAVAPATAELPAALAAEVQDGIANAVAAAPELGEHAMPVLLAAQDAFVDGWINAMWISVGLALAAAVFVIWRAPRRADDPMILAASQTDTPVTGALVTSLTAQATVTERAAMRAAEHPTPVDAEAVVTA